MGFGLGKDGITIKMIAMKQLLVIASLSSVEFRGGYWLKKVIFTKNGQEIIERTYIPDTREQYANAVNVLHDLLIPRFDDEMKKLSQEINDDLSNLREKTLKATKSKEAVILSTDSYSESDKNIIELYRFDKLQLQRELFQELSRFLSRINYMESTPYVE